MAMIPDSLPLLSQTSNRERKKLPCNITLFNKRSPPDWNSLCPCPGLPLDIPSCGQNCSCKFPKKMRESLGGIRLENDSCLEKGNLFLIWPLR
jgi:hypothetical protein